MLKRNKLQALKIKSETANKQYFINYRENFPSKERKSKFELTNDVDENLLKVKKIIYILKKLKIFKLQQILEENRALKEKLQRNDEVLTKLINKIEPKTLENLPFLIKGRSNSKNQQFRIRSAASEQNIKGLKRCEIRNNIQSHRDKSQSVSENVKVIENKRNSESFHGNYELLATFNPNSTKNLSGLKEDVKKCMKVKEIEKSIDFSNTPSFHTKQSYESSVSTNVDNSFRVKQQKIMDFSFLEKNEFICEEKKKISPFPKNLFQFMSKKNKFFV